MPRRSQAREKLLTAARAAFWTHCFGPVGVEELCQQAGIRRGSFYYFFSSKEELGLAVLESFWDDEAAAIQRFLRLKGPAGAGLLPYLRDCLRRQLRHVKRHGHIPGCPFVSTGVESAAVSEALRQRVSEILQRYQRRLSALVNEDQELATRTVLLLQGGYALARVQNSPAPLRHALQAIAWTLEMEGAR
ncbi:MAG: TetR/AcrR family transcriptional regulator [Leptospirales bacterium]|nr:TetR/AcrR family transcriptional regulator [Leptospirales bacterium]